MELDNTLIFTLARMNPPTPGHLFLIRQLIETAVNKNVSDVYIILSKTNDNNENPIPCPEKIAVLGNIDNTSRTMIQTLKQIMIDEAVDPEQKQKIAQVRVNTICVPEVKGSTPFTPLVSLVDNMTAPDINLFLIIGDDRKNMADSITDVFFKKDNVNSVDVMILPREEMSEFKEKSKNPALLDTLDISTVPVNAMSASFVRNIVKNNRKDKFIELYSPYLDEVKIDKLYDDISNGLTMKPPSKADEQERPLKYIYPMIKGQSEFPIRQVVFPSNGKRTTEIFTQPKATKKRKTGGRRKTKRRRTNKRRLTNKRRRR